MQTVLFVCTHNSARSQMAEGILRHIAGDRFEAFSAGTEPGSLHPLAVHAMAEIGVDISNQHSKTIDRFLNDSFDFVITVCDQAREACPAFPRAARQLHWSIPDPVAAQGGEGEKLHAFRTARDAIMHRIEDLLIGSRPPSREDEAAAEPAE